MPGRRIRKGGSTRGGGNSSSVERRGATSKPREKGRAKRNAPQMKLPTFRIWREYLGRLEGRLRLWSKRMRFYKVKRDHLVSMKERLVRWANGKDPGSLGRSSTE